MKAKELMQREVVTIHEGDSVETLMEVLVREHIHGLPVVDGSGKLVGVVTQQDVFFSSMTRGSSEPSEAADALRVRDIMTAPAVSVTDTTEVRVLCELMHRLRIHLVPIVRKDKLVGIVSSLDVCGAIAAGETLS